MSEQHSYAKNIFGTAETFREVGIILGQKVSNHELHLMMPLAVNAAFATELYLKCLILFDGRPICARTMDAPVSRTVRPVGKPDVGNQHVRFDERGRETERAPR